MSEIAAGTAPRPHRVKRRCPAANPDAQQGSRSQSVSYDLTQISRSTAEFTKRLLTVRILGELQRFIRT
jgi:hypothetical protein